MPRAGSRHSCLRLVSMPLSMLAVQGAICVAQPPPPTPMPDSSAPVANAVGAVPGPSEVPSQDVLTQGPLHEAYAEPINLSGAVPPIVPKQPPQPINEAPAGYRPQGENVVWIPGYWSWDDQQGDFIWVSGIWRNPPPGRQWIAGYWTPVAGGFQWTPGFWSSADTDVVQYYPQPPAPAEQGPTTAAPTADAFWSPGCWAWQNNQFVWTSGFWTTGQPNWIWTPTCYSWTPRGYVLVGGYWDYLLDQRGLAFAPVAIGPALYGRPGFVYTPSEVIDPAIFTFYLFARPAWCQYYFGDYFAAKYDRLGFYPWYQVGHGAYRYDPLFTYDHWFYAKRDPQWIENLEHWHSYYRAHPDWRPPHNLVQQARFATSASERADHRYLTIGEPLAKVARSASFPVRVTAVSAAERARGLNVVRSHREFQTQRSRVEAAGARPRGPSKVTLPHPTHAISEVRTPPPHAGGATRERIGEVPHFTPAERPGYTPPTPRNEFRAHPEAAKTPHPEAHPEARRPEPRPEPRPQFTPRHPQAPKEGPPARERPAENAPPPAAHGGEREKK